ncbi:MAG: serine--tRNA ligase [Candidatus Omnitrophica bacterium]|nr:serine--tRNA ligase [Candidatus Omnitrophota bacterium]
MLDLKQIRENPDRLKKALISRAATFDVDSFLKMEAETRKAQQQLEEIRHQKRVASDEIGRLKREGKPVDGQLDRLKEVSAQEDALSARVSETEDQVRRQLLLIPNIPHASVPVGPAANNQIVRSWGEPKRFAFQPRSHMELAEILRVIDFQRAAKISGSNFVLFTGPGARLQRGLINFMLDLHTARHGYTEFAPPYLVNRATMTGTGQLPKFEEDMYRVQDDLFLIPTAEVPVTNLHAGEILEGDSLPRYYTAYTACFRREAGSYGKETKGMTRVHQFDKVELVKFATPENSYAELESLTANAEKVLQLLELPYRVVVLASGDLGFASAKTYDLEAFSPGTGNWLEVSSCSNFEDFQARRANIRFRDPQTKKPRFVHTLNGSGVALARTIIALLENHQEQDGSVRIPKALQPYLDGLTRLTPP